MKTIAFVLLSSVLLTSNSMASNQAQTQNQSHWNQAKQEPFVNIAQARQTHTISCQAGYVAVDCDETWGCCSVARGGGYCDSKAL
jgi:hypothetical protein